MTDDSKNRVVESRMKRLKNNALTMAFRDGPGEPFATAAQDSAGVGRKLGVLFGFKNGGTGTHVLTLGERTIGVVSRDAAPTDITDGVDGALIARVERGDVSVAKDADGRALLQFVGRPDDEQTVRQYSMDVLTADGRPVARLDVLRVWIDWTVNKAIDAAIRFEATWDRAGQGLKYPLVGTRLELLEPIDERTEQILLAVCVDVVIGLRPYVTAMR